MMMTTAETEKVLKDKIVRGLGHLEYGLWQGHTFGKKWGHLT